MSSKKCSKCKNTLSIIMFSKHNRMKDGYRYECKTCQKIYDDKCKDKKKVYGQINALKIKEYKQLNFDKIKAKQQLYAKRNAGKRNALTAKRKSIRLKATPKWLNKNHLKEIESRFIEAKKSSEKCEVDHIIPLTHDLVCGLHVHWNLQILTQSENRIKKNKFDGSYINEGWKSS